MCFKKKKVKEEINSLYKIGDLVGFKRHDSLSYGKIYEIKKDNEGNVIYDIQIGGECPAIIHDIIESKVIPTK